MSKSKLSALLSLLVLVGIIFGVTIRPEIWQQLPLSSADRQLLALFSQTSSDPDPAPKLTVVTASSATELTGIPKLVATQSADLVILKPESTESAVVARVVDGDTIELADGRTVRYIGIDTPETKHPTKSVQCYGVAAANYNTQLVLGKTVVLENDVSATDRYGRLLKYVWLDNRLVNYQLVTEGYALARSFPPDVAHQADFLVAEQLARQQQLGLWAECY